MVHNKESNLTISDDYNQQTTFWKAASRRMTLFNSRILGSVNDGVAHENNVVILLDDLEETTVQTTPIRRTSLTHRTRGGASLDEEDKCSCDSGDDRAAAPDTPLGVPKRKASADGAEKLFLLNIEDEPMKIGRGSSRRMSKLLLSLSIVMLLLCCWLSLFLLLHSGTLRPQMSQPVFVRETIMILDMLLCNRPMISTAGATNDKSDEQFQIPFTLYQSWMRRDVSNFRYNDIVTFFEHNPKWTYYLYADDNPNPSETIDGWVDEHITAVIDDHGDNLKMRLLGPHFTTIEQHQRIDCAYSMLQNGASKVDLWRYLIIYHSGGLYTDFDAVLSDAYMDRIISANDTFVTSIRDEIEMDQYYVLASKHHPILARAINETTEAILKMARLYNAARGNSSMFLSLGCNQILSNWQTHAMYPLDDADFGAKLWNGDELLAAVNVTAYPFRYCTCHHLDHQNPHYYKDKLHAACLTGPNVFKTAFEWTLYDNTEDLHGIRIFPSQLGGRVPSKFVQRNESVWQSNRMEKVKDAGRMTPTWPSMGAHFIDFENTCWKKFTN